VKPIAGGLLSGVGAVLLLLGFATTAPFAVGASDSIRTYPACQITGPDAANPPRRDHFCHQSDYWGAFLMVKRRTFTHYRICIRRPDRSHDCYRRRLFGRKGIDSFEGPVGSYRFTWKLRGRGVIDRDRLWVGHG
jgi:hypothetical protein